MDAPFDGPAEMQPEDTVRPGWLRRLWQRRLITAVTFGAGLLAVIVVVLILPVSYVASGSVIVTGREPVAGASSPAGAGQPGEAGSVESTVLLLRSARSLRAALAAPGASGAIEADCAAVARQLLNRLRPIDCARLADDPDARLDWAQQRFGVGAVGRSRVIAVGYRSPLPLVAQAMVNALLQTFLAAQDEVVRHARDDVADDVRVRLAQLDGALQIDAAGIEAFRAANGLSRGSGGLSGDRLAVSAQLLAEARAAQTEAEARLQDLRGGTGSRPTPDTRPIAELRQQLAQASAAAAGAAQRYGTQNPALLGYRRQETELAARLAAETSRATDAARRGVEAARARVDAAQQELSSRTEAASQAAEAEAQLAVMTRDFEAKRSASASLAQRLSQLEAERRAVAPSVQLVDLAERPARPAFPQRPPILVGGLALATVLATTAGLLTYKPVQSGPIALGRTYTRIPILAQVPELRLRRVGKRELSPGVVSFPFAAAISLIETHNPLLEAMRILHARLALAGFGGERRTLLITSEVAGEGKSFVTLALARMARASGRRVLVMEATLRAPFLEEALHGPSSGGLAGYLRGGPAQAIQLGAVPGVDFMLAGDRLEDSTERLSGARFTDLLAWADQYDLVLIDGAPVSELMDSALIARQVDGVLFCLRTGRPPALGALNSLPEMQRANRNVVGLALTFTAEEAAPGDPTPSRRQLSSSPA